MHLSLVFVATAVALTGGWCADFLHGPPPGHWDDQQHRWIADSDADILLDLIGPQTPDTVSIADNAIHGMSFGDSNDRNIINDYCAKQEPHPPHHHVHTIRACWHTHLTMTWQPLVGVHPTGPYWQNIPGSPPERLVHGLQTQLNTFQTPPDFVTFASNLWDLWGWGNYSPEKLIDNQVEAQELKDWAQHVSNLLTQIEANVPMETMLIYRTGVPGNWGQCLNDDGTTPDVYVGVNQNHMWQLNAAAKDVLKQHPRWHLMDVEVIVAGFDCPQEYLRDFVHFDSYIGWNILNIYVNMLKKFWEQHGEPPWRQQVYG